MRRPPLANLFAVHGEDHTVLEEIGQDLRSSGEFAEIWQPAPNWVCASAPLPDSSPDGEVAKLHGLAFAEGRDRLEEGFEHALNQRFREIAELVDTKPDNLASLPGDFGFIRFGANGEATVVRSCGGLVPFYIGKFGKRIAISTQLGNFVRYLPDEPRLDPLPNAIWASSWITFPDGRTPLSGVRILERGCFAKITEGKISIGRYWNPRPEKLSYPSRAKVEEHARHFREVLLERLSRDLDPRGGNLLTLSGGVDSSSLCALSAGRLGFKVWTWSLLPPKENENVYQHDLSYIEPLRKRYGVERYWEVSISESIGEFWLKGPRIVFHVLHPALRSLPGILKEAEVKVLFGGEYGDKVCGHSFTVPDWAYYTSLLRLLTDVRGLLQEPKDLARWLKWRLSFLWGKPPLPIPGNLLTSYFTDGKTLEFFTPEVIEDYQGWYDRQKERLLEDKIPWRYLALDGEIMDGFVTMNWEGCSAFGVRRSFPFFNREVFELVFSCHPLELYGGGVKKLLRRALVNDVPHRNLFRPDKGAGRWASQMRRSADEFSRSFRGRFPEGPLPEELRGIVKEEWFSNPPKELEYWQYCPLGRLLIFVESVRKRREGKKKG